MPSIKGTASISSNSALQKQLRTTSFPSNFSQKVNVAKVHRAVFTHWIEKRIEQILGFEDDIVSSTAVNLFLPSSDSDSDTAAALDYWDVDPRRSQLDLAGFLGEGEAATFASELWTMMLDAQTSPSGIPRVLVEKKKEEMRKQREEMDKKLQDRRGGKRERDDRGEGGGRWGARASNEDGGRNASNENMNAFVREATRRAEAARASILSGGLTAGNASAPVRNAVAGVVPGENIQPLAVNTRNAGPVQVPPSPSPPRYHGGGSNSSGRGGHNEYDRSRNDGASFSNYDRQRYCEGNKNVYYPNNCRGDDGYNNSYYRNENFYCDRISMRGEDRDYGRGDTHWDALDEFGRGRKGDFGGGRAHLTNSGQGPSIESRDGRNRRGWDNGKDKSPMENEDDQKINKQTLPGRTCDAGGDTIDSTSNREKRQGAHKSSRSASRSPSHDSRSRPSSYSRSCSSSRSSTSRSYSSSSSSSGRSSQTSRSRSYCSSRSTSRSVSRSRSRSASSSKSRHSRERNKREYKLQQTKRSRYSGSRISESGSHVREQRPTEETNRDRPGNERSSFSYEAGVNKNRCHHNSDGNGSGRKDDRMRRR